nr:glycosyltransferase family 2 protein [Modestobacter muralis]
MSAAPAVTGVQPWAGQPRARVLVRLHGAPLGYLTVPAGPGGPDAAAVVRESRTVHAEAVAAHLALEHLQPGPDPLPTAGEDCPVRSRSDRSVSVVVCTRDRSEVLAGCLERLAALDHRQLEVVVVDNAPTDERTRVLVEALATSDARFRYVREPRPGLSRARNRGLAEARGEIVAYTDDDVAVDAGWVSGLLLGFARRADVACVTGLVATAGIGSPAEEYFDARTELWSTRVSPELFDLATVPPGNALYPYGAGLFGTGASIAFDRQLLVDLGGFDEALGAGARTRGGEDLDAFLRVLRAGRALAYEPSALVWHHHRADDAALLRQLFGYGSGLSAFLTKCLLTRGTRGELLRRVPAGLRRGRDLSATTTERLGGSAAAPRGATRRELAGFAAGPVLYLRARAEVRRSPGVPAAAPHAVAR